jgi:hypothetical protein
MCCCRYSAIDVNTKSTQRLVTFDIKLVRALPRIASTVILCETMNDIKIWHRKGPWAITVATEGSEQRTKLINLKSVETSSHLSTTIYCFFLHSPLPTQGDNKSPTWDSEETCSALLTAICTLPSGTGEYTVAVAESVRLNSIPGSICFMQPSQRFAWRSFRSRKNIVTQFSSLHTVCSNTRSVTRIAMNNEPADISFGTWQSSLWVSRRTSQESTSPRWRLLGVCIFVWAGL